MVPNNFESLIFKRTFKRKLATTRSGLSPFELHNIFMSYIFPRGDYASCIWIFRVFLPYKRVFFKQAQNAGEIFHITRKVMFGYGKRWRTLNSFYIDCMRRIIGVNDESPSSVAVLVRMGIMPLQYEFVYRAVLWYIKIARGETDQLLTDQLDTFSSDDSTFSMTCWGGLIS